MCPKNKRTINAIDPDTSGNTDEELDEKSDKEEDESLPDDAEDYESADAEIGAIEADYDLSEEEQVSHLPQISHNCKDITHVTDAKLVKTKPEKGKGYTAGTSSVTLVICEKQEGRMLLDQGAFCSVVSKKYLEQFLPNWKDSLMPIAGLSLQSCNSQMKSLGIIEISLLLPHPSGSVRIKVEFINLEDGRNDYFILGTDYLNLYGFDIHTSKERFSQLVIMITNGKNSNFLPLGP
jgi:hypothetical protein